MVTYTMKEAEGLTGLSDKTLRRYIKLGKLNATVRAKRYFIHADTLVPYIKNVRLSDVEQPIQSSQTISGTEEANFSTPNLSFEEKEKLIIHAEKSFHKISGDLKEVMLHILDMGETDDRMLIKVQNSFKTFVANFAALHASGNASQLSLSQIIARLQEGVFDDIGGLPLNIENDIISGARQLASLEK